MLIFSSNHPRYFVPDSLVSSIGRPFGIRDYSDRCKVCPKQVCELSVTISPGHCSIEGVGNLSRTLSRKWKRGKCDSEASKLDNCGDHASQGWIIETLSVVGYYGVGPNLLFGALPCPFSTFGFGNRNCSFSLVS